MKYRKPTSPVFWVPIPYTGQSKMDLIEYKFNPEVKPQQLTLTDPESGEDYTVEILDYWGAYDIRQLPDTFARQIINKDTTGQMLAKLLIARVPEFKNCSKVLFLQVNPINQTA